VNGTAPTQLKPIDPAARLAELEMDIGPERNQSRATIVAMYFTAGDCLRTIRDERLFTVRGHRTIGGYLRKRWRMSNEEAEWVMDCTERSQHALRVARGTATGPRR